MDFVTRFADGDMSRYYFDIEYSGYVIEHFPAFEREDPRLARRFTNTADVAYDRNSWMKDEPFRNAIADALDDFFGAVPDTDIL